MLHIVLVIKKKYKKNCDNHVLCHPAGVNDAANLALAAKVIIENKSWCVPRNSPNKSNQRMLGQIATRAALERSHFKKLSLMKDLSTENS